MAAITWDDRQFRARIGHLQGRMREALAHAVGQAGQQLLNDAIMLVPTVPIDTGRLRESGSVIVNGTAWMSSDRGEGTPALDGGGLRRGSQWKPVAYVGFNTPYACVVHERPMRFQDPSAGNKYLEAKMRSYASEYLEIANDVFRRETGM